MWLDVADKDGSAVKDRSAVIDGRPAHRRQAASPAGFAVPTLATAQQHALDDADAVVVTGTPNFSDGQVSVR
jgi:hypothetical protein